MNFWGKDQILDCLPMAKKLKRSETISHISRELRTCLRKIVTTKILVMNVSVCNWLPSVTANLILQITDGDGHGLHVINYELSIHEMSAGCRCTRMVIPRTFKDPFFKRGLSELSCPSLLRFNTANMSEDWELF